MTILSWMRLHERIHLLVINDGCLILVSSFDMDRSIRLTSHIQYHKDRTQLSKDVLRNMRYYLVRLLLFSKLISCKLVLGMSLELTVWMSARWESIYIGLIISQATVQLYPMIIRQVTEQLYSFWSSCQVRWLSICTCWASISQVLANENLRWVPSLSNIAAAFHSWTCLPV